MSADVRFCFERCIAVRRFGMALAARMPMTAMTNRPPTRRTTISTAGFVAGAGAGAMAGVAAPFVGFPQRAHNAYDTEATCVPHQAQNIRHSLDRFWTGSVDCTESALPHAELQLRRVRHHAAVPDRIKHYFDVRVLDAGEPLHLVLDVGRQHRTHAAAGGGEGHLDLHVLPAILGRLELAEIDQAEVDDVDRDLRVIARLELTPHLLLQLVRRDLLGWRGLDGALGGLADRFEVLAGHPDHQATVGNDGVGAAERLRDRTGRPLGDQHSVATGDHHCLGAAAECNLFAHGLLRYSVDTFSPSPASALCNVCQANVAHFTRAGNSDTPENAASRPSSATSRPAFSPVTSLWNT